MKSRQPSRLLALAIVSLAPWQLGAAPWKFRGNLQSRFDVFENDGNPAVSPFRFEGGQFLNNFSLDFEKEESEYERWSGRANGRFTTSDYVADHDGFILDQFQLQLEKGDAKIPYRGIVGDQFTFLTPRVLRRNLKGISVELQPQGSHSQSILLFSGSTQPSFRDIDFEDELHHGASWVLQSGPETQWTLNLVNSHRKSQPGTRALGQTLSSFGGIHRLRPGRGNLEIEGELAFLDGDHLGAGSNQDAAGKSFFYRLQGDDGGKLRYGFRREDHDADYNPLGAGVFSDSRTDLLRLGYDFGDGHRLEARQHSQDSARSTATPLNRVTRGLRASGPFQLSGRDFRYNWDGFRVRNRGTGLGTDSESRVQNLDLQTRFGAWSTSMRVLEQRDRNYVAGTFLRTRALTLSGVRPTRIGSWAGSFQAGVQHRNVRGSSLENNLGFQMALDLSRQNRFVQASFRHFYQDQISLPGTDVLTKDLQVRLGRRFQDEELALEMAIQDRLADAVANNTAYKVGLVYSRNFGWTGSGRRQGGGSRLEEVPEDALVEDLPSGPATDRDFGLDRLYPGARKSLALAQAKHSGFRRLPDSAGIAVFDGRPFPFLAERQRVFLSFSEDRVQRSGILVDLGGAGSLDDGETTLNRVLRDLVARFGSPEVSREVGRFGPSLGQDLQDGSFQRIYQWNASRGAIRLGIPRRLDGQLRIEVQYGRSFPALSSNAFSVEALR